MQSYFEYFKVTCEGGAVKGKGKKIGNIVY